MTLFAAPIVTLAVETRDGTKWLCALEHGASRPLAQFKDDASAETYVRAVTTRDRFAFEAGRSGI